MIRIDRGLEPPALRVARRRGLARLVLARRRSAGVSPRPRLQVDGYNITDVRNVLYEVQYAKCAYCERPIGRAGSPLEHFRPKAEADLADPLKGGHEVDVERYWWLAWSWNNLALACATCNSATFKGNWFPLEPGSPRVAVPDGLIGDSHACFAVGIERPLLVDPAWDDPMDHIEWRPLDPARPLEEWRAFPRTYRGRVTIHLLGLDGRNVDRVGQHIRDNVYGPWIRPLIAVLGREDGVADARAIWSGALRHLFSPSQPFHAASHDALEFFIALPERERFGLSKLRHPCPPTPPMAASSAGIAGFPISWAALPEQVVLEIMAQELSVDDLVHMICGVYPATIVELADALQTSATAMARRCKTLLASGKLVVDADGRYRSALTLVTATT